MCQTARMHQNATYVDRLATAITTHLHGPLGPRRSTDLVARLKPLIDEARLAGEPWARISTALSHELMRNGRPPILEATLRRLWQRISVRPRAVEATFVPGNPHPSEWDRQIAPRPAEPHPGSVQDLNHRSSSSDLLVSPSQAERLARMRRLNRGEV